jgi:hypothetical protein
MRVLIQFIFIFFCFAAKAQPALNWAKQFSGPIGGVGSAITTDLSGNVYSTGMFQGTMKFAPGNPSFSLAATSYDGYISKMDNAGNMIWLKQISGNGDQGGRDLTIGSKGSIFLTGFQSAGNSFFSKLSSTGNVIWMANLFVYNVFSIGVDSLDNIYATGTFDYTKDFDPGPGVFNLTAKGQSDIFIIKLDSNGVFQWAEQIGGKYTNEQCYSIAVDRDGSVYASGNFSGVTYFGSGASDSLTSNGGQDIFICKLNSNGDFLWKKQIGNAANEFNYTLALGPNNSLALTGTFNGTLDVNPGQAVYNLSSALPTSFICRFDTSGHFTWGRQFNLTSPQGGSCAAYDLAFDSQGNIITAGVFGFKVDFDLGADTFHLSVGYPLNIFIAKYNSKGNFICVGKADASNIMDIAVDKYGSMIAIGPLNGSADFDPGSAVYSMYSSSNSDLYMIKWTCGTFTNQYKEVMKFDPPLSVFPNPSSGLFELQYRQERENDLILNLYNSQGQLIAKEVLQKGQGTCVKHLDLSACSKGLYLLEVINEDSNVTQRIVLE